MKLKMTNQNIFKALPFLFLYSVLCTLYSVPSFAQEINEPITVNGDRVEYLQEKKMVTASKNIVITYKDVTMTCDEITVNLDTKDAVAEGNVKITQKDAYFTGEKIYYNFEAKTGRVVNGYVNSEPFYGKAQEMEKLSEKEVRLERGYVTTCELEKPHYRIQARQVRIYMDDKVIAKHVLFFLGKVPIMYFPYYIQPLKERSAHATLFVGQDKDWGYYGLSSYKYYFSEICKGRFLLDYRTKKGLAYGIDNFYSTKTLGKGSARAYGINENDSTTGDPVKGATSRFKGRLQLRHRWEMTDDTLMLAEINTQRDRDFIKDYFYKEYEEEGEPDNYISIITTKEDYVTSFLIRKRMDNYYTVVERLPEFKIDINNFRVGESPFYYTAEASVVYLNQTFQKADPMPKDIRVVRVDTYNQVSYAMRILGALNTTPYAGTRQTYYSRNKCGDTNLIRGLFKAGVDNSIKFYKIYETETNFLGLDIHNIRHIITPSLNYYYTHSPTISPSNLNQFDWIDGIDKENGVVLALENRLQTKRPQGENGELKSVDLATLIVSTDYIFRMKRRSLTLREDKFKSVDFQLETKLYPWLYTLSNMKINTKSCVVESASTDLTASMGDKWSLGMGHRYESVESGKSNQVTYEGTYKINEKWKVRAYGRFEVNKKSLLEQEYTVYRDLHCWLAEFTYDVKSYDENDHTFWVIFRLKAFPDMPLGLRRTYSRASPGATPR